MMSKKPTDYNQAVHCAKCGSEIFGDVYVDNDDGFYAHCYDCYVEMSEDEDGEPVGDWCSMSIYEYLDEANERAYERYVDQCIDEARGK